uniref:Probable carboxylesterase clz11 n=1 Tax=Cochliobolus lunatus TaxID=5503 RepID=CLZ11_COCLU|nr:RecName: Full=Probable carboxylesterase clz11; AltName: Full=Squalestatin S1 biosynthesis cluster protein clz11; AltName: Full=Zaragozic acid A biosynthesis cluster protein 11 [Curvularia lunata]AXF50645.1 hydrolase [Curvularia lunata]
MAGDLWLVGDCTNHGGLSDAIIVSPDYRLLPEATGADIFDDVEAFWNWLHTSLPSLAQSYSWQAQPDLTRILCVGQSGGGSMAVHSALLHPEYSIKVIVSLYAPLYHNVPNLTVPRPRRILGTMPPPPRKAEGLIRSYIKQSKGSVRTGGNPFDMWELLLCLLQQGRLISLMNIKPDSRLDTPFLLRQVGKLPPLWLIHGEDDSVVGPSTICVHRVIF